MTIIALYYYHPLDLQGAVTEGLMGVFVSPKNFISILECKCVL